MGEINPTSKVAFITGGSRGIGKGIVKVLASEGYLVAFSYKTNEEMANTVSEEVGSLGGQAFGTQMFVENRASVIKAFEKIRKYYNRDISILINNAAISQEKAFETITDEDWGNMLKVNLQGPFICSQIVLPEMIKQRWGKIVNITSIGGQWGGYNQVHYAASKAGLINFTRSIAKIYSEYGITANAVAIGLTETEMSGPELESEAGKKKVANIPIGRIATIEEIANTVKFLCSEEASYITGQTINVNGGMYFG
jgi:acetoacetyl-CoA reductase/3-oxoacyl-[acyl-carrier protein] reductase